ncbi:hypothetical protein GCM10010478_63740 [Streptomyces erythrogriseus]|uniref:Transposase n=1 Tax=Streptomyces erythrogriseus TaxID=284027 RepID=A0ABN3XGV1_9ACTN
MTLWENAWEEFTPLYMAIMSLDPTGKGQARWMDHALEDRAERLRHHLRRPTLSRPPVTQPPRSHRSFGSVP